jgi:osmotically-inducible protein OsmY
VPDERDPEGVSVAAGTGSTALDEPFDADHHSTLLPDDDEVTARVREALRADAVATVYADQLEIDTEGEVVTLRGTVEDMEDLDAVLAVAAEVTGITEVVDELDVATL